MMSILRTLTKTSQKLLFPQFYFLGFIFEIDTFSSDHMIIFIKMNQFLVGIFFRFFLSFFETDKSFVIRSVDFDFDFDLRRSPDRLLRDLLSRLLLRLLDLLLDDRDRRFLRDRERDRDLDRVFDRDLELFLRFLLFFVFLLLGLLDFDLSFLAAADAFSFNVLFLLPV